MCAKHVTHRYSDSQVVIWKHHKLEAEQTAHVLEAKAVKVD
jgi:hypothetical protein